jgi:hypothetical protein
MQKAAEGFISQHAPIDSQQVRHGKIQSGRLRRCCDRSGGGKES